MILMKIILKYTKIGCLRGLSATLAATKRDNVSKLYVINSFKLSKNDFYPVSLYSHQKPPSFGKIAKGFYEKKS